LRKKEKGEKIEAPREPRSDNVVNLMDALRRSVQGERAPASHARRLEGPHTEKMQGNSPQRATEKPAS
jgi:non-homologous end joining protein Ku